MRSHLFTFCLFLMSTICFSQQMIISGNIQDTVAKKPLPNSVVMAIRLKDSVLLAYTRSDASGNFTLSGLKIDTLELVISNSFFGDQSFYIIGSSTNTSFQMGTIVLPPKNKELKEVVIYAYKDPVYYKGDTLMYTADSFKVKPNATVEDLLKKLPGMKVDQSGKVTAQGKAVDQVLVDGDEFFGSDPTIATRNLGANTVESVQLYEKKDETSNSDQNLQVLNLKLKEDAKKGYFGKASAASDFSKFYEGELFANKFKGTQKISVFGLISNTPKTGIDYGDAYKFGLDNENQWNDRPDEGFMPENESPAGIPRSIKSGIYYTERIGKKTKLNVNYTYASNKLNAGSSSRSQYFLPDSAYMTAAQSGNTQNNESHSINLKVVQTLDSLTELEMEPRLKRNENHLHNQVLTAFYTLPDTVRNYESDVSNLSATNSHAFNNTLRLIRKSRKKGREYKLNYNYLLNGNELNGILKLLNSNTDTLNSRDINQKKNNEASDQTHHVLLNYTEPLTKKLKLQLEYNFNFNLSRQSKTTRDFVNGSYSVVDPLLTNRFKNERLLHSLGAGLLFEVKKQSLNIGARARTISFINTNLISQKRFTYAVNNLLPYLYYHYKMEDNGRINFRYNTFSNQPTIDQLQPIPDNTNPIQVKVGNPYLKPTFNHSFNLFYTKFKALSGNFLGASANFIFMDQAFTNSITYDNLGRAQIQTVNVKGNCNAGLNAWAGIPFFNRILFVEPGTGFSYMKNSNFINQEKNITTTTNVNGTLSFSLELDTLNFRISYTYGSNNPSSSLNKTSNKPYHNEELSSNLYLKLPYRFSIETSAEYMVNSNRAPGYNTNYVLWNATISKTFLKTENLVLSLIGFDLLNQNISNTRTVQDNLITDTKTTIVNRYFMIQLIYKFNNNNTKYEDF